MSKLRLGIMRAVYAALLLALMFSFSGVINAHAQEPYFPCKNGVCESNPGANEVNAQAGAYLKPYTTAILHGGYVAHGVGMRNLGYGTIKISDVPAGATVYKAYLFWSVIGPKVNPGYYYYKGKINGHAISGSLIGSSSSPCWGGGNIWGYRADVRAYMIKGGNGSYYLSGFASGTTNGDDPFTVGGAYPLIDGASLVILFSKPTYPTTTIKIYNGATTTVYDQLHLSMVGVNAVAPTGFAYTTFIVADGQNNYDYPGNTHFFDTNLPAVWSGADPNGNGVSYGYGNLWDTVTVDLHSLLNPPEPDFWFSTYDTNGGSADCVTWAAQVLAYSSGNQDSDGDKLLDSWELNGVYGVDLPGYGADPLHKDLFVEADYMLGADDHLPALAQLDDIVSVFNNAPVANPDGTTGIHIHIDTGGASHGLAAGTTPRFNLGGGTSLTETTYLGTSGAGCNNYNWTEFQNIKDAHFSWARDNVFHYMIFAYNLAEPCGTISGISRNNVTSDATFIKGATDFIVSLGGWGINDTSTAREGTFTHELGHNLGLRHGGNDHVGYKPNYLSIMNYLFQISGVYRNGAWGNYDYSRILLPSLNENYLNETTGLGPLAVNYGTKWRDQSHALRTDTTAWGIDWKYDGLTQTSVKVDINWDGVYSTLGNQNNWAYVTFLGGGGIGPGVSLGEVGPLAISPVVEELTLEQYLKDQGEMSQQDEQSTKDQGGVGP